MKIDFKRFDNFKVPIICILLVLLISVFVLYTPKAVVEAKENEFSAIRAAKHIEVISKEPHSYYDQKELKNVRMYIENTLEEYIPGKVSNKTYKKEDVIAETGYKNLPYDVTNVLGVIEGENKEGIMIVSHYDSKGHMGGIGELRRSYGALDDGYGVGTMLELVDLLKDEKPKNSIYFLFTDGEEVGLLGAAMAAKDQEIMKDVKFLIKLESRGRFGPAYMFETSNKNSKVMELYKNANFPISYSIATAVYSLMPNATDFTQFKKTNMPGINFAVLAGLENYHNPSDTYENLNMSTLQHMGTQTEPILREFMNNSKYIEPNYFESKNEQVFFTLFAGVFVSYSEVFAVILAILLTLSFALIVFFAIKNDDIDLTTVTKTLPKGILFTVLLMISTYAYSNLMAFLGKTTFMLTYTRMDHAGILSFMLIAAVVGLVLKHFIKSKKLDQILIVGIGFNVIITLIASFLLPGMSYLFAITALCGLIGYSMRYIKNDIIKNVGYVFSYLIMALLMVPTIWSFYHALTIGGLVVLVLILMINLPISLVLIIKQFKLFNKKPAILEELI